MHFVYEPKNVCSTRIEFDINKKSEVSNVKFIGGCSGNLQALSKLVEGMTAEEISLKLRGIDCIMGTSCADQLVLAINAAMQPAEKKK